MERFGRTMSLTLPTLTVPCLVDHAHICHSPISILLGIVDAKKWLGIADSLSIMVSKSVETSTFSGEGASKSISANRVLKLFALTHFRKAALVANTISKCVFEYNDHGG